MAPTKPAAKTAVKNSDGDAADIPLHLTEKILCGISPLESARYLTVCKSWASTIFSRLAKPCPHLLALQGLGPQPGEAPRRRGSIFSLPIDRSKELNPVMRAKLPIMKSHAHANHMKLSGALPNGCVSFAFPNADAAQGGRSPARSNRVGLVNPVTGAAQSVEVYRKERLFGFQPKVRAAAGAEAFFVSEVSSDSEKRIYLLWRPEGEQEWPARIRLPMASMRQHQFSHSTDAMDLVAYADGAFYAMEFLGFTFVVDTRAPPPMRMARLNTRSILEQYTAISGTGFLRSCHMLVSEGEVLFVGPVQHTLYQTLQVRRKRCRQVFRLDVEGERWVKVESLASDTTLFVSEQSSFSVRASETPGCRSNCIYFLTELGDKYSNGTCNWGVYSMEEEKVLFQSSVGSPGKYIAARWFLPRVGTAPQHVPVQPME